MYDNSTTGVQQKKPGTMPETGERIADNNKKLKITAAVVRRTMPERGRHGDICPPTPLHAPLSPSTCTAVDVYSSTYHTAEMALVRSLFLSRAIMDVQQHLRCGTGTVQGFPIFTILRHPGKRAIRPREAKVQRSLFAESGTTPGVRRGQKIAAVWVGSGATARPRDAYWSS